MRSLIELSALLLTAGCIFALPAFDITATLSLCCNYISNDDFFSTQHAGGLACSAAPARS